MLVHPPLPGAHKQGPAFLRAPEPARLDARLHGHLGFEGQMRPQWAVWAPVVSPRGGQGILKQPSYFVKLQVTWAIVIGFILCPMVKTYHLFLALRLPLELSVSNCSYNRQQRNDILTSTLP